MTDLEAPYGPLAYFLDLHPDVGDFRTDAVNGLSAEQKWISPKYFYDERGSRLFQEITTLEEYYPTRTEKEIFLSNAPAITDAVGAGAAILEYGSGASEKIGWLIKGLAEPVAYVAMDISRDHLLESASAIAARYALPVAAICADFHAPAALPRDILPKEARWLGFFPGSTIGNMLPETAVKFFVRASDTLGRNAKFLLGVDLEKDPAVLNAAYNDAKGVTAKFNMNLLRRMQRELDARLTPADFEHYAFYNEEFCRIEMHLRARRATTIAVGSHVFQFRAGETLHTENSHKYSPARLEALIEKTPWRLEALWTDERDWFAACLLSNS